MARTPRLGFQDFTLKRVNRREFPGIKHRSAADEEENPPQRGGAMEPAFRNQVKQVQNFIYKF